MCNVLNYSNDFNIQTDTVWTLFQSPIVISGRVDVTPSATLTVEPGVNVVFTETTATIAVFGMHSKPIMYMCMYVDVNWGLF